MKENLAMKTNLFRLFALVPALLLAACLAGSLPGVRTDGMMTWAGDCGISLAKPAGLPEVKFESVVGADDVLLADDELPKTLSADGKPLGVTEQPIQCPNRDKPGTTRLVPAFRVVKFVLAAQQPQPDITPSAGPPAAKKRYQRIDVKPGDVDWPLQKK